jgi:hypothetical protein
MKGKIGLDSFLIWFETLMKKAFIEVNHTEEINGNTHRYIMNDNLVDIQKLATFSQSLQSISESDLETLADKSATSLIRHQDSYELLIYASSLIKYFSFVA